MLLRSLIERTIIWRGWGFSLPLSLSQVLCLRPETLALAGFGGYTSQPPGEVYEDVMQMKSY